MITKPDFLSFFFLGGYRLIYESSHGTCVVSHNLSFFLTFCPSFFLMRIMQYDLDLKGAMVSDETCIFLLLHCFDIVC